MVFFVTAMECEAQAVVGNMENTVLKREYGFEVVRGVLCGERVASIRSGVGKVPAGAATLMAVMSGATAIVNVGVAGGLLPSMKPGDFFEADAAIQYDFDLSSLDGRPAGTLNGREDVRIPVCKTGYCPSCTVATGDRFNDSPEDHALIAGTMRCGVRDMELGAMAQICERNRIALYSLKCVSDVYGSGATPRQFEENLEMCIKRLESAIPAYFTALKTKRSGNDA